MKKFFDILEYIQLRIAALFLVVFIISIILQVATRYVPGFTALWTEDIAKYAFIWSMFLGASVMVRYKAHFSMSILSDRLTGKWAIVQELFIDFLIAAFGFLMFYYGYQLTQMFWNWSVNSLPILKQRYVWMVMPVSGLTMCLYSLANAYDTVTSKVLGGAR